MKTMVICISLLVILVPMIDARRTVDARRAIDNLNDPLAENATESLECEGALVKHVEKPFAYGHKGKIPISRATAITEGGQSHSIVWKQTSSDHKSYEHENCVECGLTRLTRKLGATRMDCVAACEGGLALTVIEDERGKPCPAVQDLLQSQAIKSLEPHAEFTELVRRIMRDYLLNLERFLRKGYINTDQSAANVLVCDYEKGGDDMIFIDFGAKWFRELQVDKDGTVPFDIQVHAYGAMIGMLFCFGFGGEDYYDPLVCRTAQEIASAQAGDLVQSVSTMSEEFQSQKAVLDGLKAFSQIDKSTKGEILKFFMEFPNGKSVLKSPKVVSLLGCPAE